jgi:hypothetical protein
VAPSRALPATLGGVVAAGATGATTAVAGDAAAAEPAAFVAVTRTRTACPVSADASRCVERVAPAMSTQALPSASQRCHW